MSWFERRWKIAALSLLILALIGSGCNQVPLGVNVGKQAPEISGTDVNGKTIKLSDYKGKVVLLDFWGTWCGPCVASIPDEREMMRLYAKRPFTILGICRDEPKSLQDFLAKDPLPWPNIVERSGSILTTWGVKNFPTWVLIDDEGVIRGRWTGGQDIGKVQEAVERAVGIAETR